MININAKPIAKEYHKDCCQINGFGIMGCIFVVNKKTLTIT